MNWPPLQFDTTISHLNLLLITVNIVWFVLSSSSQHSEDSPWSHQTCSDPLDFCNYFQSNNMDFLLPPENN